MKEYKLKINFSDGQYIIIGIEEEDKVDALNKVIPLDLEIC